MAYFDNNLCNKRDGKCNDPSYLRRSRVIFFIPGIFKDIGIIDDDTIIEVQRSDLVAEHIGGTNAKTEKILKKAEGRVLFVREAYTLSTSGKDYGKERSGQ